VYRGYPEEFKKEFKGSIVCGDQGPKFSYGGGSIPEEQIAHLIFAKTGKVANDGSDGSLVYLITGQSHVTPWKDMAGHVLPNASKFCPLCGDF
jgi:hypothetical protein